MKKSIMLLAAICLFALNLNAQIPNPGFEDWPLASNGWPVGNPIQSSDVFPQGIGNYSLRLINNAVSNPEMTDFGFCVTSPFPGSWAPSFPITIQPISFTGYYKFLPVNGDTAVIGAVLYFEGDTVSTAFIRVNAAVPDWTSFDIPFSPYELADSASVGFSAYNWIFGEAGMPVMQGNSELFIDNLNFDNLINTLPDATSTRPFVDLYPNPARNYIWWTTDKEDNAEVIINIYNTSGSCLKSEHTSLQKKRIDLSSLSEGVYMVETNWNKQQNRQKIIKLP
jgi:hypothetical protein